MSDTLKVRAAVAILPDGRYVVAGWSEGWGTQGPPDDEALIDAAREYLFTCCDTDDESDYSAVHFVEADVPPPVKPEPQTIAGEVVESKPEAEA